jgi:solute:Na+ symporter, SSS family
MSNQLYQVFASIQAEVASPITAVFLVGILWRGTTARAAITTLVGGGVIDMARFLLDIAHNALKWDLGGLSRIVEFSFLNFGVVVFVFCVILMITISKVDARPRLKENAGLTLDWAAHGWKDRRLLGDIAVTVTIGAAILFIWTHFA